MALVYTKSLLEKPPPIHGNRVWKISTGPRIEPVSVEELKLFAKIDTDDVDSLLRGFIESVRFAAEEYMGRALIQQTIRLLMDFWPSMIIELPRPPLLSVTKIATLDEDDTETEYDSDNYYVIIGSTPGKVILKQSVTAPYNSMRDYAGYLIEYKAGYGTDAKDVPSPIREAIKLWAAAVYEMGVLDSKKPPPKVKENLDLFRTVGVMIR